MNRAAKVSRIQRWQRDMALFAEDNLKILNKDGKLVPFILNDAQRSLDDACEEQLARAGFVRKNLVKGRQLGLSSGVGARFIRTTVTTPGLKAMVVCHKQEATKNLAAITRRFFDHIPADRRPRLLKKNDLELVMSSDSGYLLTTAGSKETGRGSTFQLLHGSEVAYWDHPEDHMAGLGNALADRPGSEAIRETTANGQANFMFDEWRKAEAGVGTYENLFIPWFVDRDYTRAPPAGWKPSNEPPMDGMPSPAEYRDLHDLTLGQMYWRELQIQDKGLVKTVREYPATPEEAFITTGETEFINAHHVAEARSRYIDFAALHGAHLVVGIDTATSHGPDSTCFGKRLGPRFFGIEAYPTMTADECLAKAWSIWQEQRPKMFVVDRTGGEGDHVFMGLFTRGAPVIGVYFGGRPDNPSRYYDRRAELYSRIVGWLPTADIQDDPDLARDLLAQRQMSKEQVQIRLKSKPDLRAEGHPSPDRGDVLALTMAYIDPEHGGGRVVDLPPVDPFRDRDWALGRG